MNSNYLRVGNSSLIDFKFLVEEEKLSIDIQLFELESYIIPRLVLIYKFALDLPSWFFTFSLLCGLDLINLLVTTLLIFIWRRGAKLLFFDSYQFLLPIQLHFYVFFVLLAELRFFLFITKLPNKVIFVIDLLVFDGGLQLLGCR